MPNEEQLFAAMRNHIETVGWAVTGVFDADPPFAYTVGLTEKGRPELFMSGLDINVMALILNDIAANENPVIGDVLEGYVGNGYKLAVVAADPKAAAVAVPRAMYGRDKVRALQIVWPDKKGRFPWDKRYRIRPRKQSLYPVNNN